jgi:hypothetical protein
LQESGDVERELAVHLAVPSLLEIVVFHRDQVFLGQQAGNDRTPGVLLLPVLIDLKRPGESPMLLAVLPHGERDIVEARITH